jgi:hypothetical protein
MKFVTGKTYSTRSIVDHETIYSFTILARTAKTVTIDTRDGAMRKGVYLYNGVEQFKPFGSYSMCVIVGADDEVVS